jgi:hypothetical protein
MEGMDSKGNGYTPLVTSIVEGFPDEGKISVSYVPLLNLPDQDLGLGEHLEGDKLGLWVIVAISYYESDQVGWRGESLVCEVFDDLRLI